jgi:isopentenyl diphosphate isomerase/L-lactate dehydrogenase-like FMN-dependent dehydrogenase
MSASLIVNLQDFEDAAVKKIPADRLAYIRGGAGDGISLAADRKIFDNVFLLPRFMHQDMRKRCTKVKIFDQEMSMPVIIAPTAMNELVHAEGEIAVSRAAAKANVIQTLSTMSSKSIEDVGAAGGVKWFQLYVFTERSITEQLIRRAENSGYKAIVLTVDVPAFGWRDTVLKAQFKSPTHIRMPNFDIYKFPGGGERACSCAIVNA